MIKLINDPYSDNFTHMDVDKETGEMKPHRFGHKAGSKIKEVFKMDKKTHKLVKTNEYNIDNYINSFKEETNIKDMVERLRAKGVSAEEYLKRNGGFFADITEAPGSIMEAIIMANTWEDKVDKYNEWQEQKQAEEKQAEEKQAAEKKEGLKNV